MLKYSPYQEGWTRKGTRARGLLSSSFIQCSSVPGMKVLCCCAWARLLLRNSALSVNPQSAASWHSGNGSLQFGSKNNEKMPVTMSSRVMLGIQRPLSILWSTRPEGDKFGCKMGVLQVTFGAQAGYCPSLNIASNVNWQLDQLESGTSDL